MYQVPTKHILSVAHLEAFKRSPSHAEIIGFIDDLNDSITGLKISQAKVSSRTQLLLDILDKTLSIAESIPPVDNKLSRFGNPAFRTFYDTLSSKSHKLHSGLSIPEDSIPEISTYFNESWGNKQRVDYGSGMELNFLCWLYCLYRLGVFEKDDFSFIVLGVFWKYIKVMRYLQSTYWLEPAGSHGVWGLDDYQFLPFLWGAGQLKGHKHLTPKSIHSPEILETFSSEYMYFSCISFINSIKTASLRWHSPMLDDISAVKNWGKVNEGMKKMYNAEVLGKLPVMQHMLFGSIIKFPSVEEDEELRKAIEEEERDGNVVGKVDGHGHVHEKGWTMDCCGIPVPSAFAESVAAKPGIKPIPFD